MSFYDEPYPNKRLYEIIPGALTWAILLTPVILSLVKPSWVAVFMIVFDFYWLLKAVYMGARLVTGYLHMRREGKINWLSRLKELENFDHHYKVIKESYQQSTSWWSKRTFKRELDQLEIVKEQKNILKDWRTVYHAVILPTYDEPIEVLDKSIESLKKSFYPGKKIIVVLALEERAGKEREEIAAELERKYGDDFYKFLITVHPDGIVGELKAKGANATWAGRKLQKYIDKQDIDYEDVVVSTFDCDTRPSPQYFGSLTYKYVTNPNRTRRSYQPIPIYANNIWKIPLINRLVAFGSTFWQIIESTRPWRLINFSSQAMSLKTLVDIDFWDTGVVSEDSKQYYRAYFKYGGDHNCVAVFTPVYMDAMQGQTKWEALANQYKQKRRWAWGVEHIPYLLRELPKHTEIPLWSRWAELFRVFEAHISMSTASLLIAFAGWVPLLVNPGFRDTVLAYNLPYLARVLLTMSWVGLLTSGLVSILLLPKIPKGQSKRKYITTFFMWALVAISAVLFGSVPSIDAQTRLMLGKYLGFWVTPKEANQE
jgi:cellulose synthase/poly-beta-1,6-N-acetylglucosamine synthase-like glycosyltransferase